MELLIGDGQCFNVLISIFSDRMTAAGKCVFYGAWLISTLKVAARNEKIDNVTEGKVLRIFWLTVRDMRLLTEKTASYEVRTIRNFSQRISVLRRFKHQNFNSLSGYNH